MSLNHRMRMVVIPIILACGCSPSTKTMRVWGSVNFDGRPIDNGEIVLSPIDGTPGSSVGGAITTGKYEIPAKTGPLAGGVYRVEIKAVAKTGKKIQNFMQKGGPPLDENTNLIPTKYNTESKLRITISPTAAQNQHDFQLVK